MFYLLLGIAAGLLCMAHRLGTVNRLVPGRESPSRWLWLPGVGLRLTGLAALLLFALWEGTAAGLGLFIGVFIGRWLGLGWLHYTDFKWVKA